MVYSKSLWCLDKKFPLYKKHILKTKMKMLQTNDYISSYFLKRVFIILRSSLLSISNDL